MRARGGVSDCGWRRGWGCEPGAGDRLAGAAAVEERVEVFRDVAEGDGVIVGWEDSEGGAGVDEHLAACGDGAGDGTGVVGDAGEDGEVDGFLAEDERVELTALGVGGVLHEIKNGEREFALNEIGAEGFAGFFFGAAEVETVVVDLIGGAEEFAVATHAVLDGDAGAAEPCGEFGGGREEGGRFHADDAEVFRDGETEVEAALGLEDFAGADLVGGAGDFAADVGAVEAGGEFEGVGEETIAEEDRECVAPAGGGGGGGAAHFGAVHDVVVDEGGEVDEFEDDAEFGVIGVWGAAGPAGEEGEGWADAFAAGAEDGGDVAFDGWVEGARLEPDLFFHVDEVIGDEVEGKAEGGGGGGLCEIFHKRCVMG